MFTGIIQAKAKVKQAKPSEGNIRAEIEKPKEWKFAKGQSIAVDGICSTVVMSNAKVFAVEYMPETLSKTTAGEFDTGSIVNLERSLTLKTFIDGHLVQGHVDGVGTVSNIDTKGGGYLVTVSIPKPLLKYIAALGSIALNGVSLTVARLKGKEATVALIPHTLSYTNLGALTKGSRVNIEVDLIARYLEASRHVI
jgi:riboflavin synthase